MRFKPGYKIRFQEWTGTVVAVIGNDVSIEWQTKFGELVPNDPTRPLDLYEPDWHNRFEIISVGDSDEEC